MPLPQGRRTLGIKMQRYVVQKPTWCRPNSEYRKSHPWLHLGWKTLPTMIGYCSNTNCARRFWCEDNNVDLMHMQPHYYRLWQVVPWVVKFLALCLNNNNNNRTPERLIFVLLQLFVLSVDGSMEKNINGKSREHRTGLCWGFSSSVWNCWRCCGCWGMSPKSHFQIPIVPSSAPSSNDVTLARR